MKSIVKSTVMLSSLLLLTGCWDFGWSKKTKGNETTEVATLGDTTIKKTSKCSGKGCNHDHSKDKHKKNHVKTQSMDDDSDEEEDDDAEIQSMNDNDDEESDEEDVEVQGMNADDEDDSDDEDDDNN